MHKHVAIQSRFISESFAAELTQMGLHLGMSCHVSIKINLMPEKFTANPAFQGFRDPGAGESLVSRQSMFCFIDLAATKRGKESTY